MSGANPLPTDPAAEAAIRDAFANLASAGQPANVTTVPQAAIDELVGTNSPTDEPERIFAAIEEMQARGEVVAPSDPWKDWRLV